MIERTTHNDFPEDLLGKNLIAHSVDELVILGIDAIKTYGRQIESNSGPALQAYGIIYTLLDSQNRLLSLRAPKSIRYFSRELLAYFKGSLKVGDGLEQASAFWKTLQDSHGKINSNYGYYVFHQPIENQGISSKTQYEWAVDTLVKNPDSRKSLININQPYHKSPTKDFPCTIALQYFIRTDKNNTSFLCSEVSSRSTDVITGLPYDMGFFSFMTELIWKDLQMRGMANLLLGYTAMKTSFTQIYDKTADLANQINSNNKPVENIFMPEICSAKNVLKDIYDETSDMEILKWIYNHANTTND